MPGSHRLTIIAPQSFGIHVPVSVVAYVDESTTTVRFLPQIWTNVAKGHVGRFGDSVNVESRAEWSF